MTAALMKPSEALRKARELLTPEGAWTKGALAVDVEGDEVLPQSSNAVCWCAIGAIQAVMKGPVGLDTLVYITQALPLIVNIPEWNDAAVRTQADVTSAFDRAIALAEAACQ